MQHPALVNFIAIIDTYVGRWDYKDAKETMIAMYDISTQLNTFMKT